jgi:thiol-disulfide isomerase/thioredoxin
MLKNNIFQVVKETDLLNIINQKNFVVVMFSLKTCIPCAKMKPIFVDLSKHNTDIIFVYIDIKNYDADDLKIQYTPTFCIYCHGNVNALVTIEGSDRKGLENSIKMVRDKTNLARDKLIENKINNNNDMFSESDIKNMTILRKLMILNRNGHKLSQKFNLDSNFREMVMEYYMITGNIPDIDIIVDNEHKENHNFKQEQCQDTQITQDKIKLIKDLQNLNFQEQQQKVKQIEQLKNLENFQKNK